MQSILRVKSFSATLRALESRSGYLFIIQSMIPVVRSTCLAPIFKSLRLSLISLCLLNSWRGTHLGKRSGCAN